MQRHSRCPGSAKHARPSTFSRHSKRCLTIWEARPSAAGTTTEHTSSAHLLQVIQSCQAIGLLIGSKCCHDGRAVALQNGVGRAHALANGAQALAACATRVAASTDWVTAQSARGHRPLELPSASCRLLHLLLARCPLSVALSAARTAAHFICGQHRATPYPARAGHRRCPPARAAPGGWACSRWAARSAAAPAQE